MSGLRAIGICKVYSHGDTVEAGVGAETSPPTERRPKGARRRGGVMTLALTAAAAACLSVAAVGGALPSHAGTDPPSTGGGSSKIVPIDLLLAGGHTDAARKAIDIWNRAVPSIRFVEQTTPATLRVEEIETAEGNQSRVNPDGLGRGRVYIDVTDAKKFSPTRILVHELGHILSLEDLPRDVCSKVMSGALPGPDCMNDQPDAEESAAVAAFFANHEVGDPLPDRTVPEETAAPEPGATEMSRQLTAAGLPSTSST